MHSKSFLLGILLALAPCAMGQTRRIAILESNGSPNRNTPALVAESRLTDDLTAKLAGRPGLTLVDRASVDRILKEQNFQNSDRSSADTAVKIGKLLGVGQIALVHVTDASYTTHAETSGSNTQTMGTVVLRASVRMIDVETGVILLQPTSSFQDSVTVAESSKSQGFQYGMIRVPAKQKSSGGDPKVIEGNEWTKASEAVTSELASKLSVTAPPGAPMKMESPMVAGVKDGQVYINQGSGSGVKSGDRFQVMREVSLGFDDPKTGKPMTQKQAVCVLTIANVSEGLSSGSCPGGSPQSKDVAEPVHP